jgi:hypothetical protein
MMAYIRAEHAKDPLGLLQTIERGDRVGQLQIFRGTNFELGLFLAQLTGSGIYTDQQTTVMDLAAAMNGTEEAASAAAEREGIEQALTLRLTVSTSIDKTFKTRDAPRSKEARIAMREVLNLAAGERGSRSQTAVAAAVGRLVGVVADIAAEDVEEGQGDSSSAVFDVKVMLAIPPAGYGLVASRRFLVAFGCRKHTETVPIALHFGKAARPPLMSDSDREP